jgi:heat shock protein HtpX
MPSSTDPVQLQIAENRRRVAFLLGGLGVLVFVVAWLLLGFALGLLPALVVALALAVVTVWLVASRAEGAVLRRVGAVPVDEHEQPRFHNLVEGLCVAAGLPKPALLVVQDEAPNALTIGRDPRHAAVVATTGLLEKLTRVEHEGVLAHEHSHDTTHDTGVSTLAAALLGRVAPGLVPRALGAARETAADVTGVAITRYPPGLISALEKLRDDPTVLRTVDRAVAHLWIEAPLAEPPTSPRSTSTSPPLDERIQALREL